MFVLFCFLFFFGGSITVSQTQLLIQHDFNMILTFGGFNIWRVFLGRIWGQSVLLIIFSPDICNLCANNTELLKGKKGNGLHYH